MTSIKQIHSECLDILTLIQNNSNTADQLHGFGGNVHQSTSPLEIKMTKVINDIYSLMTNSADQDGIRVSSLLFNSGSKSRSTSRGSPVTLSRPVATSSFGRTRVESVALLASTVAKILSEDDGSIKADSPQMSGLPKRNSQSQPSQPSNKTVISVMARRSSLRRRSIGAHARRSSLLMKQNDSKHKRVSTGVVDRHINLALRSSGGMDGREITTGNLEKVCLNASRKKGAHQLVLYANEHYRTNKPLRKLMVRRDEKRPYIRKALHESLAHEPRAITLYRDVTSFVGLRKSVKSTGEIVLHMLESIHFNVRKDDPIRDEVFCQIVKQICGNNDAESVLKGWELLLIVASFAPCSVELGAPLLAWIYDSEERTVERERRLSVTLPAMKSEHQLIVCAMMERNECKVDTQMKSRTRLALEHSIDRGTRIHAPCIQEVRASLRSVKPQLRLLLPNGEPLLVDIQSPHQSCLSFIHDICEHLGLDKHCASTFGVVEAECSAPALLMSLNKSKAELNARKSGNVAVESGRGSALGNSNSDYRPTTLELPTWVDEDDSVDSLMVGSDRSLENGTSLSAELDATRVSSVDYYSEGEDTFQSFSDLEKKDGLAMLPSSLKRLNPAYNNVDLIGAECRQTIGKNAKKNRSTLGATLHKQSTKNLLQWKSGRRKWHSILELAGIDLNQTLNVDEKKRRRTSTHSSIRMAEKCPLSRDPMADSDAVIKRSVGAAYRQCLIQVVSEDEVIPHEKIADVACRIVEAMKSKNENKETTLSSMIVKQLSFYHTAEQRAAKGNHYERLLFKPVVARVIDRTNQIEVCLHYEQARSDFVSGHYKSECDMNLLCQLVALNVHSTAGSHQDLSTMSSNMGLPFIKLWNLMPISEYVPQYMHSDALTSKWQNEVLSIMETYKKLTPIQSRLAFLDTCAREFTFFGASFYSCIVISDTNLMTTLGSTRLLAVTPGGILLLREKTRSDKHQNVDGVVTTIKSTSNNTEHRVIDVTASFHEIGGWNLQTKKGTHILSIEFKDGSRRFRLRGDHLDRSVRSIEVNVAVALLEQSKTELNNKKMNKNKNSNNVGKPGKSGKGGKGGKGGRGGKGGKGKKRGSRFSRASGLQTSTKTQTRTKTNSNETSKRPLPVSFTKQDTRTNKSSNNQIDNKSDNKIDNKSDNKNSKKSIKKSIKKSGKRSNDDLDKGGRPISKNQSMMLSYPPPDLSKNNEKRNSGLTSIDDIISPVLSKKVLSLDSNKGIYNRTAIDDQEKDGDKKKSKRLTMKIGESKNDISLGSATEQLANRHVARSSMDLKQEMIEELTNNHKNEKDNIQDNTKDNTKKNTKNTIGTEAGSEWERHYDTSRKQHYWHDRVTKRTTWSTPKDAKGDALVINNTKGDFTNETSKLKEDEEIAVDQKTGRKYAFNKLTRETRWL